MRTPRVVHLLAVLVLSITTLIGGGSVRGTGYSIDHSDSWWVSSESGWGLQLVQQANVIFATMYVYDTQNNPVYYTATLDPNPATTDWSGDLYLTHGPWYGAPAYDRAAVAYRKVGQMTVSGDAVQQAQLAYSIDGVAVNKTITRFTLRYDDYAGTYSGSVLSYAICPTHAPGTVIPVIWYPGTFTITQTENQLVVAKLSIAGQSTGCTFTGDYTQFGHLGRSQGTFACKEGTNGTHTFDLMIVQKLGGWKVASANLTGRDSSGCSISGGITGIR